MRSVFVLAAVVSISVVTFSVFTRAPATSVRPAVTEFVVIDYLRVESDNDPKFPTSRPVHVLAQDTVTIFARTRGIERLDVNVQLSGTESFGVFSGRPDRNGFVTVEVKVPAGGSLHDFRVPGPEGRRVAGQVQPRTIFMLQPTGVVSDSLGVPGDAVWVRIEE